MLSGQSGKRRYNDQAEPFGREVGVACLEDQKERMHGLLMALRREHGVPPPDVIVGRGNGVGAFYPMPIEHSYCGSPATLCVEANTK